MKVLLVNGSPHKEGCTFTALSEAAKTLNWNMVHGNTPEEVHQDIEGLQTMRTLARNMAFMLKCKEAGLKAGASLPKREEVIETNFIR
jgi:multimeric flavodoxin WrbA